MLVPSKQSVQLELDTVATHIAGMPGIQVVAFFTPIK
jgi:hypothetical protein